MVEEKISKQQSLSRRARPGQASGSQCQGNQRGISPLGTTRQLRPCCLPPAPASPCTHLWWANKSLVAYTGKDSHSEEEEDNTQAPDHDKPHLLRHDLLVTAGQKWRPATRCCEACTWPLLQPTKVSVPSRSGRIWPSADLLINSYFLRLTPLHSTVPPSNTRPQSLGHLQGPRSALRGSTRPGGHRGSQLQGSTTNISPSRFVPGRLQAVKHKACLASWFSS